MNALTRGKWLALLCLLPFALFFIVFEIAPLVWVLISSLQTEEPAGAWKTSPAFSVRSSTDRRSSSAWRSVSTPASSASSSPPGQLFTAPSGFAAAQLCHRVRQHDQQLRRRPLAFAFIILLGFNGSITLMLKQAGIIEDFNLYSKTGLIILYTYFQIPLGVLLLYPAFDALREDWRESAALLGANGWQFWRHIGLPVLTRPCSVPL